MRNLNKDEKQYIYNEISTRVEKLSVSSTEDIDKKIKTLLDDAVLSNEIISKTLKFLETIYDKDEIFKGIEKYRSYNSKDIDINFNFDIKSNCILHGNFEFKLDEKTLKEVSKQQKIRDTMSNLYTPVVMRQINIEKYYILFSTWTAPSSERLNKINELIEMIWKDIKDSVSKILETIK